MTAEHAAGGDLTGRVVRRGDADYPTARAGWNLLFDHHPMAIVFARETSDVVTALAWARRNRVAVRVRSGGHCLEGWNSVDDGMVIDVSEMKSAAVDEAAGTATVGAGLNQLEAVTALGAAGVAAATGTEGSVGLVGATLGGGFGLLTRAFGMASDNLLAAEVVVAAGVDGAEAITVSEDDHADLLWALRGAGNGNFGVVTSLTYRVHPLRQTVYVTARWPGLTHLREVFHAWQGSAPFVDERMTSQLEIGQGEITLIALLAGGSGTEAARILEPILAVGDPAVTMLDGDWADVYAGFQIPNDDEESNWKFSSQFVSQPFTDEAVDLIGAFLAAAPAPGCNYFANAFGGAVTRTEPSGGSAFAHRGALFYAEPGAGWGERGGTTPDEALTARCLRWTADFAKALAPFADGAYVNVPNADDRDFATAYWGTNVERLRTVKANYEPLQVFRYEQSITP